MSHGEHSAGFLWSGSHYKLAVVIERNLLEYLQNANPWRTNLKFAFLYFFSDHFFFQAPSRQWLECFGTRRLQGHLHYWLQRPILTIAAIHREQHSYKQNVSWSLPKQADWMKIQKSLLCDEGSNDSVKVVNEKCRKKLFYFNTISAESCTCTEVNHQQSWITKSFFYLSIYLPGVYHHLPHN